MKSHLSLFVVHQRKNWVCPQENSLPPSLSPQACRARGQGKEWG